MHGSHHETNPLVRLVPLATVFVLGANLLALLLGIGPNLDTRLVEVGEQMWPGYASTLRHDPVPPDCVVADIEAKLATCPADAAAPTPAGDPGGDPFGGEDPVAAAGGGEAPAPAPAPAPAKDPFEGQDPFATGVVDAPQGGDTPFGDEDPFAAAAGQQAAPVNCAALRALKDSCVAKHDAYTTIVASTTPSVKAYRSLELMVSGFAKFPYWKHLLALLIIVTGASATLRREHISLRRPTASVEHVANQLAQLVAHVMIAVSCAFDWGVQSDSTAEASDPAIPVIFLVGFSALALINVTHLIKPPTGLDAKTSVAKLLMVIPLYAYLSIISGVYFLAIEQHWSGQAIYLHQYIAYPNIYLGIALYIWAGMLLAETRVANLGFDVISPWKLSPFVLAWLVAVVSAVPTAYSGASGIFVLATGKVIFDRLREAGAPRRVALGATAMSGSLGVVLRPCLIIVLIAVMNKQVTTDALFEQGFNVFLVTSALYLLFMLGRKGGWVKPAPAAEAMPKSLAAVRSLVPYGLIMVATIVGYAVFFKMNVNEHTAAYVLPALLLGLVLYDWYAGRLDGLMAPLTRATNEASHNSGALLMIMAASVGFGGIVERSEIMERVPHDYGSPVAAMALLVLVMVGVGMAMDALGAVILVTVTVAPIAYENGIDPVHFWCMALVGFELGYLHPPVGLNILLARQVVGPEAELENYPEETFFARYEHFIVPCTVVATALLVVAFVPFLWYPIGS